MKYLIFVTLIMASQNILANELNYSFVCKSKELSQTVVLRKLSPLRVFKNDNGRNLSGKYSIYIQSGILLSSEFKSMGVGQYSNEMFFFKPDLLHKALNVTFEMFLHGQKNASLIIGDKSYSYNCLTLKELFLVR